MKLWNNIKSIYRGIFSYIFKGLKFASLGSAKTVSKIASIIIVALMVGAFAIEAIFYLLYKATEFVEEKTYPDVQVKETPKVYC